MICLRDPAARVSGVSPKSPAPKIALKPLKSGISLNFKAPLSNLCVNLEMADKKPTKWDYDKIPSWGRRFAPLDDSNMSPEQKKALSTMLKGPRVKILGPSSGWLRSPEMMTRAQHFGDFVRGSEVSAKLKEMTILITGRFWDAEFEWYAHEILARAAGLNEEIIQSIKRGLFRYILHYALTIN